MTALACDSCAADPQCSGWRTSDVRPCPLAAASDPGLAEPSSLVKDSGSRGEAPSSRRAAQPPLCRSRPRLRHAPCGGTEPLRDAIDGARVCLAPRGLHRRGQALLPLPWRRQPAGQLGRPPLSPLPPWTVGRLRPLLRTLRSAQPHLAAWRLAVAPAARLRPPRSCGCLTSPPAGSSWGRAGDLGGYWYSTPISAECAPGVAVGTHGCAWRVGRLVGQRDALRRAPHPPRWTI